MVRDADVFLVSGRFEGSQTVEHGLATVNIARGDECHRLRIQREQLCDYENWRPTIAKTLSKKAKPAKITSRMCGSSIMDPGY